MRGTPGADGPPAGAPFAAFGVEDQEEWQLEVVGAYLNRDINIDDWLLIESEKHNEKFDGFAPAANGYVLRSELSDGRFAVTAACKDQNRLVMARASFPRQVTQTGAFPGLIATVGSLRFLQPTGISSAEPLVFVSGATRVPFRFSLPASWRAVHRNESRSSAAYAVQHMQEEKCMGRMEIQANFNGKSTDELLAQSIESLAGLPAKLGSGPVFGLPARDGFGEGKAMTVPIQVDGEAAEATVIVISGHDLAPEANVSLQLIGPLRPDNPEAWALNKRALEIAYVNTGFGQLTSPGSPPQNGDDSSSAPPEDANSLEEVDLP